MRRVHRRMSDADCSQASFNDMLFNSLGVFLLLLIAMMAMVGLPDVSLERLKQAEEARKRALEPRPIDVVIVCDATVSMASMLAELQSALKSVAEIGSRLSPEFRLGVVIYRDAQNTVTFPLTTVGRTENGVESSGMSELRSFIERRDLRIGVSNFAPGSERGIPTGQFQMASRMTAISGYANVEGGLRTAVQMFGDSDIDTRCVFVIIGDVGPWEAGNPELIEPEDRQSVLRCTTLIDALVEQRANVRVLSVFTGRTTPALAHRDESAAFFRSLATAGRGDYTEDTSRIASTLLEAILTPAAGEAP